MVTQTRTSVPMLQTRVADTYLRQLCTSRHINFSSSCPFLLLFLTSKVCTLLLSPSIRREVRQGRADSISTINISFCNGVCSVNLLKNTTVWSFTADMATAPVDEAFTSREQLQNARDAGYWPANKV